MSIAPGKRVIVLRYSIMKSLIAGNRAGSRKTGSLRIPISVILEQIAQGESWDDLLNGYPELKDDIKAVLLYARASVDHTEVRAANA